MGDRVLFQVVTKTDVGPVVYGHWSGMSGPQIVSRLKARMHGRGGDIEYATARLVQEAIGDTPDGNTCFGVWNATARLSAEDSHGDAGVVLIHCDDGFRCECMGGYLVAGEDGLPVTNFA